MALERVNWTRLIVETVTNTNGVISMEISKIFAIEGTLFFEMESVNIVYACLGIWVIVTLSTELFCFSGHEYFIQKGRRSCIIIV